MPRHDADRRRAVRAPLLRQVEIQYKNKTVRGRVVDLSATGAFIETREEFQHEDECQLLLNLPGEKKLTVDSVVCYIHEGLGIGVEFKDLTSDDATAITDCVAKLK